MSQLRLFFLSFLLYFLVAEPFLHTSMLCDHDFDHALLAFLPIKLFLELNRATNCEDRKKELLLCRVLFYPTMLCIVLLHPLVIFFQFLI